MKIINFDLESIAKPAQEISFLLKPGVPLLLFGEMGAGKTTLTKHILKVLGSEEEVTSPTFTIMQSYAITSGTLWHIDLYRLQEHHIDDLGLDELSRKNMMIIEWPERLMRDFFSSYIKATLNIHDQKKRVLILEIIN